ncbi:MAG: phage tail tape measure protein [Faecalibacillus intestinalis]|uniref:phage tail tape measure protein n=1 Tax=Faecalibacillus intestinalis TaxID=1982626 RepID=UPI00399BEA70
MNYMAMAGWNTQQMIDGLPGILNLAAASGESLANTSDIVTDALTAFGLKAEDSSHFADVLAKTSSSANTNVSLMGETFKYVAPLAGTLGFSVEDTALAVGLMANAGIKGSQAGTALKTAIANLASPTDSMKEQMKKLGISITDTNGSVKPLITILEELRTKFGKLSSAQQSAAASTIFGKESMSGMLAIINASDSDFNSLYENIKNADGAAKDMADTMQDNLQGDLTTLSSALEGVGIKVSEVLEPALRDIVEAITDLFSWLNGLDDEITNTIVIIGTVVAAIGPLLVVIGTLAGPISTAISLFGKFKLALFGTTESAGAIGTVVSALSGPVLAIIALVVATVAALVNLWNTNEGFRNAVVDIASQVMSILQNLAVVVQPILDTLKIALLAIWQEALVPLWENFQIVIANIVTLISWLFDGISPIINAIVSLIEIIVIPLIQGLLTVIVAFVTSSAGLLGSFLSSVSGIIDAAIQAIRGLIYFITGVFTGDWRKAWEGVIDIFGAIFNTIRNVCRAPINAVIGCLNGAISGINKMIDGLNTLHFDIPDWVPALGGKSFGLSLSHLGKIPALATGGNLLKGSAIVGERGAELLTQMGTQTRVTPLTDSGGSNKQELIDYQRLADVFVNALVRAGLSIKLDRRELGKLIRSEVY